MWKSEGYGPLRRPSVRTKSNIKMNLRNVGWGDMNCTDLAENMDRGGLL